MLHLLPLLLLDATSPNDDVCEDDDGDAAIATMAVDVVEEYRVEAVVLAVEAEGRGVEAAELESEAVVRESEAVVQELDLGHRTDCTFGRESLKIRTSNCLGPYQAFMSAAY